MSNEFDEVELIRTSAGWQSAGLLIDAGFKAEDLGFTITDALKAIQAGTAEYGGLIKELWEAFKNDPSRENAQLFIDAFLSLTAEKFQEWFPKFLMVEELAPRQRRFMQEQIDAQSNYIRTSLLPDLLRGFDTGRDWNGYDHRLLVLYPGFMWHAGMLGTVVFDGLSLRDLADLFIFAGPNDSATCDGPNGCEQYANKIFTVAQILAEDIIPGRLKCLTNCRHMLIPVASPLTKSQKDDLRGTLSKRYNLEDTLGYRKY